MLHSGYIVTPDYSVDRVGKRVTVRLPGKKYAEWPSTLDVRLAGWAKPAQLRFPTSFLQWINFIQVAYRPYAHEHLDRDLVRLTWFREKTNDVQQYDLRPSQGFAVCRMLRSRAVESKNILYVEKDHKLDAVVFQELLHNRHLITRTVTKSDQGVEEFRLHWNSVNQRIPDEIFDQRSLLQPGDRFRVSPEYRAMLKSLSESLKKQE